MVEALMVSLPLPCLAMDLASVLLLRFSVLRVPGPKGCRIPRWPQLGKRRAPGF